MDEIIKWDVLKLLIEYDKIIVVNDAKILYYNYQQK